MRSTRKRSRTPLAANAARLFASTDESRYILNGVLVEVRGSDALLVATDGRTMAVICANFEEPAEGPWTALIRAMRWIR